MSLEWFYALMAIGVVGGIMLEAYLENEKRKRRNKCK